MINTTVYVAGPITNKDHLQFLKNLRQGITINAELMKHGYAPYNVFSSDLLYSLITDIELTIEDFVDACMAWLYKADVILFTGDWKNSVGCMREYREAHRLKKPIFYSIEELINDPVWGVNCGKF